MDWRQIVGHGPCVEFLREVIASGRIASAYLFCGPEGVGKRTVAHVFAQTLLCEGSPPDATSPCDTCPACRQVIAESHPDLILVGRPRDRAFIPIDAFIGADGKMREGLCHDLSLKPFRGGRKVAIVDDADFMNQEGANSLLKTLEEPPPGSVLILIGTSPARQLATIRSRCQRVLFQPLRDDEVEQILLRSRQIDDPAVARRLASVAAGSVKQALVLNDPAIHDFRAAWLRQLAADDPGQDGFSKTMATFIDQAGTDGAAKRDRMRMVCEWAIYFFQHALRLPEATGVEAADATLTACLDEALAAERLAPQRIARSLERCLDVHAEAGLNLNQALWIDCLLTDLAKLACGAFVDVRYV